MRILARTNFHQVIEKEPDDRDPLIDGSPSQPGARMQMAQIGPFWVWSLSQLCNVGGNLDLRGVYERGSVMLIKGEKIVEPPPIGFYCVGC
jgi:hypothetical protein